MVDQDRDEWTKEMKSILGDCEKNLLAAFQEYQAEVEKAMIDLKRDLMISTPLSS